MRIVVIGVGLVALGACGGAPELTPAGTAVKLMKSDPPAACTEIASVDGRSAELAGGGHEGAKNRLRNNAGEKGANYVRIESVESSGNARVVYTGTAYKCP